MLIQYIGNKKKISLGYPISPNKTKQTIDFTPNEVKELSDEEGKKLLELNKHSNNFVIYEPIKSEETEIKEEKEEIKIKSKNKVKGY